ncbi:TCO2 protein, partial [Bucco capensis]|nr:TCO2 protein [Bucco capensis]
PETGRLALYLLGLQATCPPPDPSPQHLLVTWLKHYLEEDWAGSRRHGHPLTSYYQYSLGVLALCVHRKRMREEVIRRLLAAEHHGRFRHAGHSAVEATTVVAWCPSVLWQLGVHQCCGGFLLTDTLMPISLEAPCKPPGNMTVRLVVECPLQQCDQQQLYKQPVPVPAGASLLDVLRAAATQEPRNFTFGTQDTSQGPFLTRVMGRDAQQKKHTYWQLLTDPNTSLDLGVAQYRPHDGETIILRLSEW